MAIVYKIFEGTIMMCRKRFAAHDEVLSMAHIGDVANIEHQWDGDTVHVLLCDRAGRVIFDINRDVIYPPEKKRHRQTRFHQEFRMQFLVPIATDKVFSTVDLDQLAPKLGAAPFVIKLGHDHTTK